MRVIYPKYRLNQTCYYWLITPNQYFVFKLYLLTAGNCRSASGQLRNSAQLQNNSVNGAMLIAINHVINPLMPGGSKNCHAC